MNRLIEVAEVLFPYDPDEYGEWTNSIKDVSDVAVKKRTAVCGAMGRDIETYSNQAWADGGRQNFPEVVFACHLVELGYPRDGLIYENYSFSKSVIESKKGERFIPNIAKLRSVLSERVFSEFDALLDLNPEFMVGRTRSGMIVDLIAIDAAKRNLGIYEVKKYSPGAKTTEAFPIHQQFTIAALRHIFATLGAEAFVIPPWSVSIDLISFVTDEDLRADRVKPVTYPVQLNT